MNIKITRKKIKNLILKIDNDGQISISAPYKVSDEYIKTFINSKKEWIAKKLKVLEDKKTNTSLKFITGEKFIFLGKEYFIQVVNSLDAKCEILENKDIFIINTPSDELSIKQKIVTNFLKHTLKNILIRLNNDIGNRIGYLPSQIKIRDMKTRWGSCNSLKRSITYNLQLYTKPIEIIEYIVLHELSHIPYPHHQKEFWTFVGNFMPDYKEKRKILNNK